jgi:hypothetical protein
MRHNMQHIWPGLALMAATSSGGAWAEPTSTDTHGYEVQNRAGGPLQAVDCITIHRFTPFSHVYMCNLAV